MRTPNAPYADTPCGWGRFAPGWRTLRGSAAGEVVLKRQRGAGDARRAPQAREPERACHSAHMIAAVDDAESVEIEVHEIANHLIGQTHIGAPLRNRILIEVFNAEFAHVLDEHAVGLAKTEIHVKPLQQFRHLHTAGTMIPTKEPQTQPKAATQHHSVSILTHFCAKIALCRSRDRLRYMRNLLMTRLVKAIYRIVHRGSLSVCITCKTLAMNSLHRSRVLGIQIALEIVNFDELSKTNPLNLHTISPVCSVCIDRGYESTSFGDTDCIRRNQERGAK